MRLTAHVLPSVRRLVPSAERGLTLALVAFAGGLEIVGRRSPSDVYDAVAALAVVSVAMFVLAWHRRYPLPWLLWTNRIIESLTERAEKLKYDVGLDFRGTPPLPRRAPRAARTVALGLVLWAAVAAGAWLNYPAGWRDFGLATSYTAYIVLLVAVWGLLLGCSLAGIYIPVYVVDQKLKAAKPVAGDTGVDAVAILGYGLTAVLVALVTPPVYAAVLCAAVFAAAVAWYAAAGREEAGLLWRGAAGGPVYALPLGRVLAGSVALIALLFFDLLITAAGGKLLATPALDDPMFVTMFLGSLTAWLVPGLAAVLAYHLIERRRTDPARVTRPAASILGDAAVRRPVARVLRGWGWAVTGRKGAIKLHAVPAAESQATEFDPAWPLKLNAADLANADVKHRLYRRDEIYVRRRFYKALNALLKRVKAEAPAPGGGFWLAPHWWFIEGVQWEEPEKTKGDEPDALKPIGPAFTKVFGPRVRQHLYQMLRGTQIDLIYIEDGVGPKAVDRVLRALFEWYDVHAGRRPATDTAFAGVPKVKVMVHEYSPGNPFKPDHGYPEPSFDDVSRFRVLHLFKDRGGEEVDVPTPYDFSWEPSPMVLA